MHEVKKHMKQKTKLCFFVLISAIVMVPVIIFVIDGIPSGNETNDCIPAAEANAWINTNLAQSIIYFDGQSKNISANWVVGIPKTKCPYYIGPFSACAIDVTGDGNIVLMNFYNKTISDFGIELSSKQTLYFVNANYTNIPSKGIKTGFILFRFDAWPGHDLVFFGDAADYDVAGLGDDGFVIHEV